jgi:hypothetical protein
MFNWYGLLGILLIITLEFILFFQVQPFVLWFTPFVWIGYILVVDSIVYMMKKDSLLMNHRLKFLQLFLLSISVWYTFEIYNHFSNGWFYSNLPNSSLVKYTMGTLSFATIIPAVFETFDLVRAFHFFQKLNIKINIPTNKYVLEIFIILGLIFLAIPILWKTPWIWVFVWTGFIFLLDPLLYLFHDEKSLIAQIKKKKFSIIISIFIAGYVCGFFWEFWNYWAYTKWYYTVPILDNVRIFEIPVVGFLAYGPFALELYVIYNFIRLLFSKRILGKAISIKN